jgi:hypothetical protein
MESSITQRRKWQEKNRIEANKDGKPIIGTPVTINEGDLALENFEDLAKKIFTSKNTKGK